ncbi:ankyrin repeat-containing domain protein [Neocallimastix sp. 'constans']
MNIIQYLMDNDKLSKKHLNFLLNRKFNINSLIYSNPEFNIILNKTTLEYIIENVNENAKGIFSIILKYTIFTNDFILNLITIKKHHKYISDKMLNNLIYNEKKKLVINKGLYEAVITCNDSELLNTLFLYDTNFDSAVKQKSIVNEVSGYRLLSNAVPLANYEILQLLNKKGFSINEYNDNGITPLIQAIYFNKINFIPFLIKNGADVNKKSKKDEFPIVSAIKKRNIKILNLLLKNGANPNQKDSKGNTALMYASQFGIIAAAKILIDNNADINAQNEQGLTALIISLISNRTALIKYLLSNNKIDLNLKCKKGLNALMYAAKQSHFDNLKLLIDKLSNSKIDINLKEVDNEGLNALIHSCYCGSYQKNVYISNSYIAKLLNSYYNIVEILLNKGFNVHKKSIKGQNALMIASEFGCLSIVKLLIEHGIDINGKDNNGQNALLYACRSDLLTLNEKLRPERENLRQEYPNNELLTSLIKNIFDIEDFNYEYSYGEGKYGYIHLVKYLINQGINIYAKDDKGNNALMEASSHGFINIIEYLLEKGIPVEERNNEGYTALMYATKNGYLNIVKCLIKNGASINDLDTNGNNLLMLASSEGFMEIVEYLKEMGLSIHSKNKDGNNALMLAIMGNHINIIQYLHHQGINLYEKDNHGCNALMLAANCDKLDIVQYLCDMNMNVNKVDNNGWTPLMYATFFNGNKKYPFTSQKVPNLSTSIQSNFVIIQCLVDHGAEINYKNHEGVTALMLASQYGSLRVVKYLIQMGANLDIVDNEGNDVIKYAERSIFFENYLNLIKSKIERPSLNSYYTSITEATCIPKSPSDIFYYYNISHFKSSNYELLENYLKSIKK